jgi:hypothetical protein
MSHCTHCRVLAKKILHSSGLEPGSSGLQEDAMTTVLRCQRPVFFKTSVGANSRVGTNSAECHHCVGVSLPRRRKNPFKKLASEASI